MYCPDETPAGICTGIVWSPRPRPSPRHFLHGALMTTPSPEQVGHGTTETNCPKKERCARRTSPPPLQVRQVAGVVPGSAPLPSHLSQGSSSFTENVRVTPVATSSSVSSTVIFTS